MIFNRWQILFAIVIYSGSEMARAATVRPASADSNQAEYVVGECLNNSVDNKCNQPNELEDRKNSPYVYQTLDEPQHINTYRADDLAQLTDRIKNMDRIDANLLLQHKLERDDKNSSAIHQAEGSGSTLRQVIFIHRHGDRTPVNFQTKDPLVDEPFWNFHGLGQLTNRGKARLYLLGEMMRARYDKFLNESVNKNQRISRSSGSLRCIESAQTFLSSFLLLDKPDSPDAQKLVWDNHGNTLAHLWQPVNIQSVPTAFDGMLAESAYCKNLMDEYSNVIDNLDFVKKINTDYKVESEILSSVLGFEMDHFYKWFWASSQLEVERSYFESKMRPELLANYDRIQEAGNLALTAYQITLKSKRLRSGLLINDMIGNMRNFRDLYHSAQVNADSSQLKKFVHYAAHDMTLIVLLGMLDNWHKFPFRPDYSANIAMELHQINSNGRGIGASKHEWIVRIFYMPVVPSNPFELHVESCESDHPLGLCTLDKLTELMQPYMIDGWQAWMRECGNDFNSINPYAPGS